MVENRSSKTRQNGIHILTPETAARLQGKVNLVMPQSSRKKAATMKAAPPKSRTRKKV